MCLTLYFIHKKQIKSFVFKILTSILFLALIVVLFSPTVYSQEQQRCSMRGICGYRNQHLPSPCPIDEPPKSVNDTSFKSLEEHCPELAAEYGNNLCCSEIQIEELVSNLMLPKIFLDKCPSCYHNFRQSYCYFTCSPYQRQFVNVTSTELLPSEAWKADSKLVESVKTIDFFVTRDFAEKTFDSCKSVRNGNDSVMDLLCGGEWGSKQCTAERWYTYMGSTSNGHAPFDTKYILTDLPNKIKIEQGKVSPFHYNTYSCGQTAPGESATCDCEDCPLVCPVTPSHVTPSSK